MAFSLLDHERLSAEDRTRWAENGTKEMRGAVVGIALLLCSWPDRNTALLAIKQGEIGLNFRLP